MSFGTDETSRWSVGGVGGNELSVVLSDGSLSLSEKLDCAVIMLILDPEAEVELVELGVVKGVLTDADVLTDVLTDVLLSCVVLALPSVGS